MKFRRVYSLTFTTPTTGLINDSRLAIRGAEFALYNIADDGRTAKATTTIPVDRMGLSIRVGRVPLSGGPPQKGVYVPESMVADGILHSAVRVLSFVLDTAIEVAVFPNKEVLIPESDADEDRLTELGSLPSYVETRAQLIPHAWTFESITAETLDRLLSREIGLALYSDALRLRAPNGRFRELWRVLESAFGQKDRCLLASLAKYPPAVKLEYDPEELRKFSILRGRASHAESSAGLSEYHRVSQTVEDFLPRIQSLVQEVLLTKKNWGSRDLSVKRLAPLRSYVKRDGTLVLVPARPGAKQRGN